MEDKVTSDHTIIILKIMDVFSYINFYIYEKHAN